MKTSVKRLRSFMAGLLSFLLSLATVASVLFGLLTYLTHSPSFAFAVAHRSGYTAHMHAEIQAEFLSYSAASNIDESFVEAFFKNTLTEEKMDADTKMLIANFFKDSEETFSVEQLRADLKMALTSYAEEKGYELTTELQENLENIAEELSEYYRDYLSILSASYFTSASKYMVRYRSLLLYACIASSVVALLAAIFIRLFFKKASNYSSFYVYAFSAATLMLLLGPAILLSMNVAGKINLASKSIYYLAVGLMKGTLWSVIFAAGIPLLLTILFVVVYVLACKKEEQAEKEPAMEK